MKKIIGILIVLLLVTGCGNPKLANGEEVVAEIDGLQITANDIYEEMKNLYGTGAVVELIDNFIANQMVETTEEAKLHVESMIEMYKMQYGDQDWEELLLSSGFRNQKEFENILLNNYKKEKALEMFVIDNLNEEDVLAYYENDYYGPIDVRHILIRPDENVLDPIEAEEAALEKARDIIKKLDDGAEFAELAKEYSDDTSADNGGLITGVNKEEFVEEFFWASVELAKDEYTNEPVKTQFGYHIILKLNDGEKPPFATVEDEIKKLLAEQVIWEHENKVFELWSDLRREYNLEIFDDDIRGIYNNNFLAN